MHSVLLEWLSAMLLWLGIGNTAAVCRYRITLLMACAVSGLHCARSLVF